MKNFLLLLILTFLIAACRVESSVFVNVEDDGTGSVEVSVELDDEASRLIGNIEKQLRTEDLVSSNWKVSLSENLEEESKTVVLATKNFVSVDSLVSVLEEIAGPSVFSEVSLLSEKSFAKKLWTIEGKIDLSDGLSLFSDPALDKVLGGNLFGRSLEDLSFLSGCDDICNPADSFLMNFSVSLPGAIENDFNKDVWTVPLGDRTPTPFLSSSTVDYPKPKAWRTVSYVFLGSALLFLLLRGFRNLTLLPRVVGNSENSKKLKNTPEIIENITTKEKEEVDTSIKLVVVGGKGVIWDGGADPEGLLVPFVRENGGLTDADEIADRYRSASLGQLNSEEFWESVGVRGDSDLIDAQYLNLVRLRSDALPFLNQMKRRGIPVACITNSVLSWSQQLRERLGFKDQVEHWVVSGEYGVRKPSNSIFEALRRLTGVSFSNMLLVDSDIATLEAARGLGMSTVLMQSQMPIPSGFSHPKIESFAELFGN
jgi:HAD superfamily hydrolase (TIGR01509 family)